MIYVDASDDLVDDPGAFVEAAALRELDVSASVLPQDWLLECLLQLLVAQ